MPSLAGRKKLFCITSFHLNLLGYILGFLGALIIFRYGIPNMIDTQGHNILAISQENPKEKTKIKRYRAMGRLGLGLVTFSFLLQFAGEIIGHQA